MSKIQAVEMGKYIEEYLSMRDISLIVLLLDIRHTPTEDDKLMYSYILKKNIPKMIKILLKLKKWPRKLKIKFLVQHN